MGKLLVALLASALSACLVIAVSGAASGWIGSRNEVILAAALTFLAALRFVRPGETSLRKNLPAAAAIAIALLLGIAIGRAATDFLDRGRAPGSDALMFLLVLAVATIWWLIPAIAYMLALLGRIGSRMGGRDPDAPEQIGRPIE